MYYPRNWEKILEEIHKGACSSCIGRGALAIAAFPIGYYWPSLREDAMTSVRKYKK